MWYSLVNKSSICVAIWPRSSVVRCYFVWGSDRILSAMSKHFLDEIPVFDTNNWYVPQRFFANNIPKLDKHVCGSINRLWFFGQFDGLFREVRGSCNRLIHIDIRILERRSKISKYYIFFFLNIKICRYFKFLSKIHILWTSFYWIYF